MSDNGTAGPRATLRAPTISEWDGDVLGDSGDPLAEVIDAIVEGGHGFVFSSGRELTRAERRRSQNLYAIDWVVRTGRERVIWTPKQIAAVALFYRVGIPEARAARLLRITRQSFDERLANAERAAQKWYTSDKPPRRREKKGRPGGDVETLDGTQRPRSRPGLGEPEPDPFVAHVRVDEPKPVDPAAAEESNRRFMKEFDRIRRHGGTQT
jgi:hypothetical protein